MRKSISAIFYVVSMKSKKYEWPWHNSRLKTSKSFTKISNEQLLSYHRNKTMQFTSLATVTPSLTIFGDPYLLSRTTFLPFRPRVTPMRSASLLTPVWNNRGGISGSGITNSLNLQEVNIKMTKGGKYRY